MPKTLNPNQKAVVDLVLRELKTNRYSTPSFALNKQAFVNASQVVALPVKFDGSVTLPQDWNASDSTFGQFYPMVGFDPLQ